MSALEIAELRQALAEESLLRLEDLEVFASIPSTNTHLLAKSPPAAGRLHVALAEHQTAGRGRRARRWLSPPGAGLCLSVAYTFAEPPGQLPSLTLAIGVAIVHALEGLGVAGIGLKWPNDIVARDSKLGGVLTEVQSARSTGITVVVGVGLNVWLPGRLAGAVDSSWTERPIGLGEILSSPPRRERIAAEIVNALTPTLGQFETTGFTPFAPAWRTRDWLSGRAVSVEAADGPVVGIAQGVDDEGALIVTTAAGRVRIVSGTVTVTES